MRIDTAAAGEHVPDASHMLALCLRDIFGWSPPFERIADQIFPAMLASIRGAKKTVLFETYIYWSCEIGEQFAQALSERARAGVKVHVLMDWIGSGKIDAALIDKMKGPASRSSATTRCAGTTWAASTTARTASC